MSGFTRNIYNSDRITKAIALLGGATAHSYSSLSLHNSLVNPQSLPGMDFLYSRQGNEQAFQTNVESAVSMLDKSTLDSGGATPVSGLSSNLMLEELLAFDAVADLATDKDMTSLFDDGTLDSADLQGVQGVESSSESDLASLAESSELGNQAFSLLDFIEQAVAEAEAPQDQFADALDPTTEPVFGANFYTNSIEMINGVVDSFIQPIASNPASVDELTTYLG